MKKTNCIFLLIFVFITVVSNITFSNKYLKDGYEIEEYDYIKGLGQYGCQITNKTASEITKTGNPLDLIVALKEFYNGELLSPYDYVGDYGDDWYDYLRNIRKKTPHIIEDLEDMRGEVDKNLKEHFIPTNDNFEYRIVITKTYNIKKIIALIILLVILIILYVLKKKKVFIIIGLVLFVYGILSIKVTKQIEDKCNHIEEYLLGISDKYILKNVNIDVDKTKEEISDKLNLKWDISKLINDYIVKVNACFNVISKNEVLTEEKYDTYDELGYSTFSDISQLYNEFGSKNILFDDNISIFRCKSKEELLNIELFEEIAKQGIFYEDLSKICNNINDYDMIEFAEFCKNISLKVAYNEPDENGLLFKYLEKIIDSSYVCYSNEYYDNSVISHFKDWYIGGESRDIELPYGVTLEYRAPEFIKKDIKEIVYTNERELDHDSKEKQVYVMYYKDSDGKLGASYTDIEFTKTGTNYEISFNPVDLMYDIKKPTARLVVK